MPTTPGSSIRTSDRVFLQAGPDCLPAVILTTLPRAITWGAYWYRRDLGGAGTGVIVGWGGWGHLIAFRHQPAEAAIDWALLMSDEARFTGFPSYLYAPSRLLRSVEWGFDGHDLLASWQQLWDAYERASDEWARPYFDPDFLEQLRVLFPTHSPA
jgi:hypothetical protein